MKQITVQLDDETARLVAEIAEQEQTSLEELICSLLAEHVARFRRVQRFDAVMADLRKRVRWDGTPVSRDARNTH